MELILGMSLMLNGVIVGLYLMGRKEEKKIMKKHIEGFTQQYLEKYKEFYA